MKMPEVLDKHLIAICGMNCMVCYKHLITKKYAKKCHGCRFDDETLPDHCRSCRIKDCARDKGLSYCFQCDEFPCKWIKNMDRSYRQRYHVSLIEQGLYLKEHGINAFLLREQSLWKCNHCGGVISLHDAFCSECNKPYEE